MPSEKSLENLYKSSEKNSLLGNGLAEQVHDYLGNNKENYLDYFQERLIFLRKIASNLNVKIVDLGCTNGDFIKALEYQGYLNAVGLDINEPLVKLGLSRGINLFCQPVKSFFQIRPSEFDVVYATNILEHIASPNDFLDDLKIGLKKNAHLVITVPNFSSLQVKLLGRNSPVIDPPHHVNYFTYDSLQQFLVNHGFEVIFSKTVFWSRETDMYLINQGMSPLLAKTVRSIAKLVEIPICKLNLGGVIQVVAKYR
jgi:2-polyprenyl-3-methyl-5-hydroxy-6-metoxy-1,4-benzoquinol methylase